MAAETITKDMLIGDILDIDVGIAQFFMEIGMHCLGCPAAQSETIEEACTVHGINVEEILKKLNS